MSSPSLNVSASALPPIQHGGRHGSQPSASQSGFSAIMQSLSEKGGRSKGADSTNKTSAAAATPSAQDSNAAGALPIPESQAPDLATAPARPLSAFLASVPYGASFSSSIPQDISEDNPAAALSGAESSAAAGLLSALGKSGAPLSSDSGLERATRAASVPDQSPAGSETEAFSKTAAAMGLRVSHAASHLGLSLPSHVAGASSASAASAAQPGSPPSATESKSASIAEIASRLAGSAGGGVVAGAGGENGAGSMMSFSGVSFSLVPRVIANAADSIQQPEAAPSSAGATSVSTSSNAVIAGARELEVQLSPPELGSLNVKLKLVGSALSVVIEASKPSTLSAIERERDTLIGRITSADHEVSSLILRPSESPPNAPEDADTHSQVSQNGSNAQQQTAQRPPWREAGASKKDSGPENASPSDSPGYLVV